MLTTLSLLAFFSGLGMVFVVTSHIGEAREAMNRDALSSRIMLKNFILLSRDYFFHFGQKRMIPFLYRNFEKIIFSLGNLIQRVEKSLLKFDNYIRGRYRTKINNSGDGSKYWGDIIEFKNDLNNNGEENKSE